MLPLGIHFGLDEAAYHADPGLGSTDTKALRADPTAYWFSSWMNPAREAGDDDTPSKRIGRAVHAFVLYGRPAFEARYFRCQHPGNVKAGKDERAEAEFVGKTPLSAKDYDRISLAGTLICANPEVANAFQGGASEVSVIYERQVDGEAVRCKARFDYLKIRSIPDLKSHAPMDGMRFETSALRAIKSYGYAVQAAAYLHARSYLAAFVRDGLVHGDHDTGWLRKVAASKEYAFTLIFWASSGAPLTWGGVLSPENPLIQEANVDIDVALQRFVDFRREFGTERAWIKPEPLAEIDPYDVKEWWRREIA